jgi:hypothetical protein
MGLVAALGIAVWTSSSTVSSGPAAIESTLPAAAGQLSDQVRTGAAHGTHAGYNATVLSTSVAAGSVTLTTLDVLLSAEGEPASAPTATAVLTGTDRIGHSVPLTIVGAGHWTSPQFTVAAGHYTLTTRFNRRGGPVVISMTILLT